MEVALAGGLRLEVGVEMKVNENESGSEGEREEKYAEGDEFFCADTNTDTNTDNSSGWYQKDTKKSFHLNVNSPEINANLIVKGHGRRLQARDVNVDHTKVFADSFSTLSLKGFPRRKKSVGFTAETKTWDGVRSAQGDFDELLFCFLVKEKPIGDGDVLRWTNSDYGRVLALCFLMNELIYRVRTQSGGEPVPCLPKGGGHALRIEPCYEPYMCTLMSVLLRALKQSVNQVNVDQGGMCETEHNEFTQAYALLVKEMRINDHVVQRRSKTDQSSPPSEKHSTVSSCA